MLDALGVLSVLCESQFLILNWRASPPHSIIPSFLVRVQPQHPGVAGSALDQTCSAILIVGILTERLRLGLN